MERAKPGEQMDGVLNVHFETGYEGLPWAFQDARFISENTNRFACSVCGAYWDKSDGTGGPIVDDPTYVRQTDEHRYCAPGQHVFKLVSKENWSYDGLHILSDGDTLTVYDKKDPSQVVWSGTLSVSRRGIAQNVEKTVCAEWFTKGYPARLLLVDPTKAQ